MIFPPINEPVVQELISEHERKLRHRAVLNELSAALRAAGPKAAPRPSIVQWLANNCRRYLASSTQMGIDLTVESQLE